MDGDPTGLGGLWMGSMTPDQQDQLRRTMMAQALMGNMRASGAPQSSGWGAMNQGLSPILNAVMLNRMMQPQQPGMPQAAPQGFGGNMQGLGTPGWTPGQSPAIGAGLGGAAAASSPSVGPGLWGDIGSGLSNIGSGIGSGLSSVGNWIGGLVGSGGMR